MILLLMLLGGLAALILGAEALVRGSSRLALTLGISPLVIGLTVVAFGTGSPELAVSVGSVWSGKVDLALGNVVGSNLFNVLFILGLSALVTPLVVDRQLIRQEVPVLIGVSALLLVLALDGGVSRLDGLLLVALLAAHSTYLIVQSRRAANPAQGAPPRSEPPGARPSWDAHRPVQLLLIVGGLALLVLGARWLVDAAVAIALAMGVSELVVGLTIVAAGTSLPEVATSVLAAIRGERDIAVGNVVGSNIFNILGVLGVAAVLAPRELSVAPSMIAFDLPAMVAVAIACLPVFFTGRCIARWEGAIFLGYYLAYTAYLLLAATQHDALDDYRLVMLSAVVPLTLLTLGIVLWREMQARAR